MKESGFVRQNKKKWSEFENYLKVKGSNPRTVSKLFVQITDDLAYSRTFYKNRTVRVYLNGVAQLLFNDINKQKRSTVSGFLNFWKTDVPLAFYQGRRAMLIAFILFASCFVLGVITSIYDPEFARSILGDNYVNMTNENIEEGSPMAVYGSDGEMETFTRIAFNNLRVAFYTFFSGIVFSIGTLIVLIYNGVMVGVFQYFFIPKGVFWESFLTIWTHGTLEISGIIICGGAGLLLGGGLLFPGAYSRLQAFKMSARHGLTIMLGVSPVIFFAAFVEGFLTRHTDIGDVYRLSFILVSLLFIVVYYIWYPRWVARNIPDFEKRMEVRPVLEAKSIFNKEEILNGNQLFSSALRLFFKNAWRYSVGALIGALAIVIALVFSPEGFFGTNGYDGLSFNIGSLLSVMEYPLLAGLLALVLIPFLIDTFLLTSRKRSAKEFGGKLQVGKVLVSSVVVSAMFLGLNTLAGGWSALLICVLMPFIMLIASVALFKNISFFQGATACARLLRSNWLLFAGISIKVLLIECLLIIINAFVIKEMLNDILVMLLTVDIDVIYSIKYGVSIFLVSFSMLIGFQLFIISSSTLFFTMKETNTAEALFQRIQNICISK